MVLDPNWGTNLFRTYQDARRSRLQEQEAADEAVTRGLQRQQMQAGMARQVKQDAAMEDVAAEYERQAAQPAPAAPQLDPSIPAAPIAPPRPTKTPPDALSAGGIPGVKLQPSLKGRPGVREAIQPAMEDAIVKKAGRDPSFFAKLIPTAPLMAPSLKAKLVRAGMLQDVLRVDMQDRERAIKAPLEAFNLQREVEQGDLSAENIRHGMRDRDATRAETKRHHGILETDSKARREMEQRKFEDETSYGKVFREKVLPDAARGIVDAVGAAGGAALKWATGSTAGQVAARRAESQAEIQRIKKEMESDRLKWKAGESEKDRASRAAMNKDRIKGALERAEGKWKSDQLIAEAGNRVRILIANAGQQGLSDRQLERERDIFVRQMVRDGEVSEDSAIAAFDAELDSAWIGEGSIKVPKRAGPPIIDPNAGNVRKTGKSATLDDIDARLNAMGGR